MTVAQAESALVAMRKERDEAKALAAAGAAIVQKLESALEVELLQREKAEAVAHLDQLFKQLREEKAGMTLFMVRFLFLESSQFLRCIHRVL